MLDFTKIVESANLFYKEAAKQKTAIIIKGNPKFIKDNDDADKFYDELKEFLEGLGYKTKLNAGRPYTQPAKADVWIGHSRGGDRLRFAPKNTKTIAVGYPEKGSINHPKDNATDPKRFHISNKDRFKDFEPNKYHYTLSPKMKQQIIKTLNK